MEPQTLADVLVAVQNRLLCNVSLLVLSKTLDIHVLRADPHSHGRGGTTNYHPSPCHDLGFHFGNFFLTQTCHHFTGYDSRCTGYHT